MQVLRFALAALLIAACSGGDEVLPLDASQADASPDASPDLALTMSPQSHDFGEAPVGGSSATLTVSIDNPGGVASGPLTIDVPPGFTASNDGCSATSLEPGAGCSFELAFTPSVTGPATGELAASATPGGRLTLALTGQGQPAGALVITPAAHDFGLIELGDAPPTFAFTVANSGQGPSGAIGALLGGTQADSFALVSGCQGETLGPGESCQLTVRFDPQDSGRRSASLSVKATPGGVAVAALVGRARTPAALTLVPDPASFGAVQVNTDSDPLILTAHNEGEEGTGPLSTDLTGTGYSVVSDGCSGHALEGGGSCTVSVRLHPPGTGAFLGTLGVSGTPGGTATAALTGQGATPATLEISPASQDLGSALVGGTGTAHDLTVRNAGGLPTGALAVALDDPTHFELVSTTCPAAGLAAGASCLATVRLAPASRGMKTASLVASASPGGSASATLTGLGLDPARLAIVPTSVDYGVVTVGGSSTALGQLFTVSNQGDVASGAVTLALAGDSGDFVIVTSSCGVTLAPGGTCTSRVRFAPQSAGSKQAMLTASASPGGSASAELKGTGLGSSLLKLTPTSHDYGSVAIGGQATFDFTLENLGSQSSALSASIGGTGASAFTITGGTCGSTLAAGAMCTYTIKFSPSSSGSKQAGLIVTGNPGGLVIGGLTGSGI